MVTMNRTVMFKALIVSPLVAAVAALVVAAPAAAHSELTGVDPAEGSTIAAGSVVTLTFNEDLIEVGTDISVTDSAGVVTPLTPTRPSASQVAVTMPALADGAVTIAWRVVSADGHPIEGTLAYAALAPSPSASPTPAATATPSATASASPSAEPSMSATAVDLGAEQGDEGSSVPAALWVAVGAGLLASLFTVLIARRAKK